MCGIVGWIKPHTDFCRPRLVQAMADSLVHRGPDDEGYFFSRGIGLGHKRLSIIDIERGHQPMMTGDGRFVIVYNGEVYNFPSLRRELENMGRKFYTRCDTEVILQSFVQWGTDAFARFQGMFALAIWDATERMLFMARDQLGIKPLYYTIVNDEFLFASEIKSLFCHPDVRRRIDPLVASTFLAFNNTFGRDSCWSGIERCLPGEYLTWHHGYLTRTRFFDIKTLHVDPFQGNFNDAVSEYQDLFVRAVKDHLISDVPVGAYLSGGIDSTSVALVASRHLQDAMPVFTGYFEDHEHGWYDERNGAKAVAASGEMIQHECLITSADFQMCLNKVAYHLDEPTLGSGTVPQYIVAKAAQKEVKVVLTGHGGDELFAGYPVYKSIWLRENGLDCNTWQCLRHGGMDEWIRLLYFLIGGMADPVLARGQFRMFSARSLRGLFTADVHNLIFDAGGIDGLLKRYQPFPSDPTMDGVTRWYIGTYLPTLLVQEDKISMSCSIEGRVPICYEPLVRFALSLSGKVKLHNGELKSLPRHAMKSFLPSLLYRLPKRGFPTPVVDWLSGDLGIAWEAQWGKALPGALEGIFCVKPILDEFRCFRKFGAKLPNAYALAHRLVSLQMLLACAEGLETIRTVTDVPTGAEAWGGLPGPTVLNPACAGM